MHKFDLDFEDLKLHELGEVQRVKFSGYIKVIAHAFPGFK